MICFDMDESTGTSAWCEFYSESPKYQWNSLLVSRIMQ